MHWDRPHPLVVLLAAIALVAGCGTAVSPSPPTAPTTPPTPAPSAALTPAASAALPPASTLLPTPTPSTTDPFVGKVVVTVSDNLVVRSEPRVSHDSIMYEPWLPLGTELKVLGGPVSGSGYTWYHIAPVSLYLTGGQSDGWVAAAGKDGEPWIALVAGASPCVSMDVYVVRTGDTLVEIADRHGVRIVSLLALNPRIKDPRLIRVGDRIIIPPRVIDLGSLGDSRHSAAHDINDRGQIVGLSDASSSGEHHAVLWEGGTATDLGVFGGRSAVASAINDRGQITIKTTDRDAFLWQYGSTVDLGFHGAWDINSRGEVVGGDDVAAPGGDVVHAVLWWDGTKTDLGTLGGSAQAQAINERGQVVGSSETASGSLHGFMWQDGAMTDLGTLGGTWSFAGDVNERGQVVGISETASGSQHAFLWEDGTMTDLGTLGGTRSEAKAINDCGQVVGVSETASGRQHAFLWEGGTITDLGTLGGPTSEARAIDDRGQIVGWCRISSRVGHACLWELGSD